MRIEIDFENKVIKVAEKVNFKKLLNYIKTLPDWKDYELDTNTQISYQSNPIWVNDYKYDWWRPTYTFYHQTTGCSSEAGTRLTTSNVIDRALKTQYEIS